MTQEITAIKRLAPEDIAPGLFIAITGKYDEVMPYWLFDSVPARGVEYLRVPSIDCADGEPLRILAVCLPFVLTEEADGRTRTLDIRQHMLASVDEMYALELFTRPDRSCSCR